MILVDIALVIIVVAGITAGASVYGARRLQEQQHRNDPSLKLAKAIRLLDQVRQADDILASLPSTLSEDIHRFVEEYYREGK